MNTSQLTSTQHNQRATSIALLLIRLGFGILMIPHGYTKLTHFAERQDSFMNFLGLSSSISLSLVIFSELFCSVLLVMGLFTRLATIPLIITALVIVFVAHEGDIFGDAASGFFYLLAYVTILLTGPGHYSLDHFFSSKSANLR